MMTAQEVTLVPAQHAKVSCSCGCSPCTSTCCRLDCLERPRFYCGQLLTDRDLTGLVDWTLDKVRLGRFRHGRGVVCGLDVRCDPDPKRHTHVIVGPGYAVSCCGDDIVVCEETGFDLGEACRKQLEPCTELRKPYPRGGEQAKEERGEGNDLVPEQLIPVDLFIDYAERLEDPQTAFGRSACREVDVCEPGRTREGFCLSWRPGTGDPVAEVADRWSERYRTCRTVVDKFESSYKSWYRSSSKKAQQELAGRDVQRWLFNWITEHPLHHFCFIRDRICATAPEKFNDATRNEILFFLVQDCRNAFLQCACFECSAEDAGVRLARIYVLPESHDGKTCCRVQAIVPYPPYRRHLSLSCWPARFGDVNLGGAVWLPWTEGRSYLRGFDVALGDVHYVGPQQIDKLIGAEVVFKAGTKVDVLVLQYEGLAGAFDGRVVGFTPAGHYA